MKNTINESKLNTLFESVDADMEIKQFLKSPETKKVLKELEMTISDIVIDDKYKSCVRFKFGQGQNAVEGCIRKQGDTFYFSAKGPQYATQDDGKAYGKSLDVGIIRRIGQYITVDEESEEKETEKKPEEKKPESLHDSVESLTEGLVNDIIADAEGIAGEYEISSDAEREQVISFAVDKYLAANPAVARIMSADELVELVRLKIENDMGGEVSSSVAESTEIDENKPCVNENAISELAITEIEKMAAAGMNKTVIIRELARKFHTDVASIIDGFGDIIDTYMEG